MYAKWRTLNAHVDDKITGVDFLVGSALERSAQALAAKAPEIEPAKMGEIKDLTPAYRDALRIEVERARLDPASVKSHPLRVAGWPSKSNVDLSFRDQDGALALLELKWDALSQCVWDVAKLALAVAEGQATFAYIVAGARAKTWSARKPGTELFDSAERSMVDLRGGR